MDARRGQRPVAVPEAPAHRQGRWRLETRLVHAVDSIAAAPALREIGVSPKSLRQHSHISLGAEQGRLAEALLQR